MTLEETTIKRLLFIKYLHDSAIKQSKMPAPMSSAAILTFHDIIEQFLILAYITLDGTERTKNIHFMQYWTKIRELPNGVDMTQKGTIEQLKDARVNLKHQGHLIHDMDIEKHRSAATSFLNENTPLIFGIQFFEVSLVNLIQCNEVNESIKNAENMLQETKLDEALDNTALAFFYLIYDYENRKKDVFGKSPFFFGNPLSIQSSFSMGLSNTGFREFSSIGGFVDKTKESLEDLSDAMKILSLGIDFRKYAKFKMLTPEVIDSHPPNIIRNQKFMPNKEDVEFCINFVIESAITLQEFDFSTDDIINTEDITDDI
ncbi:MAG: hypothetical protein Q8N97_05275 [Methanobacteriaceae archaeon]|nr:hypothetical protein [Methanobacteriaceae archaeon]